MELSGPGVPSGPALGGYICAAFAFDGRHCFSIMAPKKFFKCATCYASNAFCTHVGGGQKTATTMTKGSGLMSARGKKFFKCNACYASGAYCTHGGGKKMGGCVPCYVAGVRCVHPIYSPARGPAKPAAASKKKEYPSKQKKKLPDAEKVSIPVLDAAGKAVLDCVPMNGVRVRGVRLTNPDIVDGDSKRFVGKVCWRGVTEFLRYEFDGAGPFLHRRVVFQSAQKWEFQEVRSVEDGPYSWARWPCVGVEDPWMCAELKRLFGSEATVRDVLYGKVCAKGVEVVEDRRKSMKGDESGARRVKKFWNGFGKNKNGQVVNYVSNDEGTWWDKLVDDGKSFNVYVLDVFQYGIHGLDRSLPCASGAGKKRSSDGDASPVERKRAKGEVDGLKMEMDDMNLSDYVPVGEEWVELGETGKGTVKILSEMRLYWYDPK